MLYWDEAFRIVRKARWPTTTGKPIDRNTYLILDGSIEEPRQIRFRYHATDILVLKPNREKFICTGWTSKSTLDRCRGQNIYVHRRRLPSLNGYRTNCEAAYFLSFDNQIAPFDGNARYDDRHYSSNYIRIDTNGCIDYTTVNPIEVKCIVEPEKLRKAMRHLGKISKLLLGVVKLNGGTNPFKEMPDTLHNWLTSRMNTPLEEIKLLPYPWVARDIDDIKNDIKRATANIRFNIANERDWLGRASLLKNQ